MSVPQQAGRAESRNLWQGLTCWHKTAAILSLLPTQAANYVQAFGFRQTAPYCPGKFPESGRFDHYAAELITGAKLPRQKVANHR